MKIYELTLYSAWLNTHLNSWAFLMKYLRMKEPLVDVEADPQKGLVL